MYKFSAPMPYNREDINSLLDINNQVEKSAITSLYFSLPVDCELYTGFEAGRNIYTIKEWNYWKKLISYSVEKNIDFIYLLNSPKYSDLSTFESKQKLEKLDVLLNELQRLGVKKLRIAEHKIMSHIEKCYPYFDIYASTSFEFKSISEYQNFMFMHPIVKQIVPSHDHIKNFTFLKNFKKLFDNIEIELIANEGCIFGCPNRNYHALENFDKNQTCEKEQYFLTNYYNIIFCHKYLKQSPFSVLTKSNIIYPWEIEEYGKIGINNFKLVGRDCYTFRMNSYLNEYLMYLRGIDNIKNIENIPVNTFIHHLSENNILDRLKVKDYKKYLPNIKYFVKNGHLCASRCGVQCRYCYNCAEKIEKVFQKEIKRKEKLPHYIPVCKISDA